MSGVSASRPLLFIASLVIAFATVWLAARPPAPVAADAPETVFSASRAMRDVEAIAARPHTIGSADIERVRAHIASRLQELGLAATIDEQPLPAGRHAPWLKADKVRNVIAMLQGSSPDLPAILLMAHYDTVPGSPGAADDTAGVASMLEIIRNLKASGQCARNVIFLFTEGEEAGLLGSRVYFADPDIGERIALVLNLEARGGAGRVFMFETSREAGGLIDVFTRAVASPSANSLMAFVYRHMPNGTDLTPAMRAGIAGMNFAFLGDEFAYHTSVATPERLNQGSLQHMGDQLLALTRAFSDMTTLPVSAPDLVYSDVLGLFLISYPVWAGWMLILVAAGLLVASAAKARALGLLNWRDAALGAGTFPLVFFGVAIFFLILGWITGLGDLHTRYTLLAHYCVFVVGAVLVALGISVLVLAAMPRRLSIWNVWVGGFTLFLCLLIVLQLTMPLTAFLLAWPLLLTLMAALTILHVAKGDMDHRAAIAAMALFCLPAAILALQWGGMLFTAIGTLLPAILALPVLLVALPLLPWTLPTARDRRIMAVAALLVIAGGACVLGAAWTTPPEFSVYMPS